MSVKPIKILFICNENIRLGGAVLSLMDMLDSLGSKADPIILFRSRGPVFDYVRSRGYKCLVHKFKLLIHSSIFIPLENALGEQCDSGSCGGCGAGCELNLLKEAKTNGSANLKTSPSVDVKSDFQKSNLTVSEPKMTFGRFVRRSLSSLFLFRDRIVNKHCIEAVLKDLQLSGYGKPDIVHSNSGVIGIGQELAQRLGAKHVWHLRELSDVIFEFKAGVKDFHSRIAKSDSVIAISDVVYEHFSLLKHPNAQVIRDTISLPVGGGRESGKYLLYCSSSITKIKGAEDAVEIFCRSGFSRSDYILKMAGPVDEDYKEKLLRIADRYSCRAKIEFTGFTDNLLSLFNGASLLLQCSHIEALGRVTVEAMLSRLPVIARNIPATSELIMSGCESKLAMESNAGNLKEEENVNGKDARGYLFNNLTEAVVILDSLLPIFTLTVEKRNSLMKISEVEDEMKRRVERGYAFASKEFSKATYSEKILNFYNSLIKES